MTRLSNKLRKTYGVSRSEAKGMTVLIFLSIALLLSTIAMRYVKFSHNTIESIEQEYLDSLVATLDTEVDSNPTSIPISDSIKIDPNTSGLSELLAIGLDKTLSSRLIKYREHGGRFRKKADIKKIYGLNDSIYNQIESHIILPSPKKKTTETTTSPKVEKSKIDLNIATVTDLTKIKGIGETLANRIIKFRNALGGYYSIEQLKEVYGLKDRALSNAMKQCVVKDIELLKQLNINATTFVELKKHPYIDYNLARNIIGYREKNDSISNVKELITNGVISQDKFDKLESYLITH